MEEIESTTSEKKPLNYFNLLREIDKLLRISTDSNNPDNVIKDIWKDSKIDTIFDNITQSIYEVSERMPFEKRAMFIVTIFNTLLRVCAVHDSLVITSQTSFQSTFKILSNLTWYITAEDGYNSLCANDLFDSMLTNLAKDDLAQKCFKRLLSSETISIIDSSTNNEESLQDEKIDFHKVVNAYMQHAGSFAYSAVIQSAYEFRKNHSPIMMSLLENINNCLINTDIHLSLTQIELLDNILSLLCSLTDKVPLIPMFVSCGYVEKIVQWIGTDNFASHIDKLGTTIFIIVHNLSRDKIGLKQLRTVKAFDTLKERKQLVNDRNIEKLTEEFGATLITLATNDETSEENKILILDTSRKLYEYSKEAAEAAEAAEDNDLKGNIYHLSELMELLHRAFSNTYVIKDFLENKTNENPAPIEYFPQVLLSIYGVLLDREADDLEKRAAEYLLKILLQISSYPEYRQKLIENNQFCVVIESLANRPKQDDAKRIWCNLQQQISPEESQKEKSSMIYISYDWADQEFCKEFVNDLKRKITIPIWVDYEHIEFSDDMWEYLSSKITSATLIIVLVSTAYGESSDKFQELSYTISNNKLQNETNSLIVVKTEPNFSFNRSWMRDLLCDKTIIPFENNIGTITNKVRDQIVVSKKSFFKCLSCPNRNVRRKTTNSDASSPDSRVRLIKSDSVTVNRHTHKEPQKVVFVSDTVIGCDSGVSIPTTKRGQNSIVSSLTTQTGSADCSTWV